MNEAKKIHFDTIPLISFELITKHLRTLYWEFSIALPQTIHQILTRYDFPYIHTSLRKISQNGLMFENVVSVSSILDNTGILKIRSLYYFSLILLLILHRSENKALRSRVSRTPTTTIADYYNPFELSSIETWESPEAFEPNTTLYTWSPAIPGTRKL